MKKIIIIIVVAFLCLLEIYAQNNRTFFASKNLMLFGSYYYPEQWDSLQWERDLKNMSDIGIDFTHLGEFAWAELEPEEGVYNFGWLDRAVDLAQKYGMKVILCTPTPTPPVWLTQKHPEVLMVNELGITIQHGRRQHASWSSSVYKAYVRDIVTRLAQRYGGHPAVIGWQIDNEPGHYGKIDYSENALKAFRSWLVRKYGLIDRLNDTWGTSFWSEKYQNFNQVRMPNAAELLGNPNPHAMLDYKRFIADEVASFVNMQADILHEHINSNQWVTTNVIPIHYPIDPLRMDHLDFLTYTRYPVSGYDKGYGNQGFRISNVETLGFPNDQFRNYAGKQFGVMELQPGQVNWGIFNAQPLPGAVRLWMYHVFAGGGKFVCNYRFRQPLKGSEQYHYGLMQTDGVTLSQGGREYKQTIQEMELLRSCYKQESSLPSSIVSRRVGILFTMDNYNEMQFQPQTNQWNTMDHVKKYYKALKSFAAPVDIISESEDFNGFPFLLAPSYQLLDRELVERWREYVYHGGHLILTCRTGQKDREAHLWEDSFVQPIHALTGIKELFFDHLPSDYWGKIDFNGKSYQWNNWADVISTSRDVEIWGSYADQFYKGAASVIHRKLGKGTVTYIGVDTDEGILEKDILKRVYNEAGVIIEDLPEGVLLEWRDGFYIALNYNSEIQYIDIPLSAKVLIGSNKLDPAGVTVWY